MDIAIIDDDKEIITRLSKIVSKQFIDARIIGYQDNYFKILKEKFDLVFFDIVLKDINGIDLAKQYKKLYPKSNLVFMTTELSYMHDTFEVNPYYFIRKDYFIEDLDILFNKINEDLLNKKVLSVFVNRNKVNIDFNDITYIESFGNNCFVHENNIEYKVHLSMTRLLEQLDERFCRINKSEVINFDYVIDFENNNIILKDNTIFKVSRKDKMVIFNQYHSYIRK